MSSPPPNSGCYSSSELSDTVDATFISSDQRALHECGAVKVANATFPGEFPHPSSKEPSTGIYGSVQEESKGEMNSPIGSVNSHQSFNDEVAELHDYLEKDELIMMQDLFKTMDLDDVGKIRWDQARVVMAKMGRKLTDDQFAKLVDRYDLDKNGDLEFSEFCSMYLDHMKRRIKNNDTLLEVFAFLDRHEHGRVSREDVKTCLEIANIQLPEEDLDVMLQSIGLDDDGTFCFADLVDIIN